MSLSQKCQYALRAIFELARRADEGPIKIAEIAREQAIPPRFLEVILNEMKHAGFVESRRGADGGYLLTRSPKSLTVGEVIRFVEGPIGPVGCVNGTSGADCPLHGDCVFLELWEQVRRATSEIYDSTTFADLVRQDERNRRRYVPTYQI